MTRKKLEHEIAEMKKELAGELPADIRKVLKGALETAEDMLEKGRYEKPGEPASASSKEAKKLVEQTLAKGHAKIDECKEILAKYKQSKDKEHIRLVKRKKAGKPPELTVKETVKKAAKAVARKVENKEDAGKKGVTAAEAKAARGEVVSIVQKIMDGLESDKEKREFISGVINDLSKIVDKHSGKKAERGMHVPPAGTEGRGQIRILHYKTQNFDVSPEAREYFMRIMANEDAIMRHKTLVVAMARDVDELLGKVKQTELTTSATRADFTEAAGSVMKAMYWLNGIVQAIEGGSFGDPQKWYPGFLAGQLYIVADHLKGTVKKAAQGTRLGVDYENGDEVVEKLSAQQLEWVNDSLSNDEHTSDEELVEQWGTELDISAADAKHIIKKYRPKFSLNPLFELTRKGRRRPYDVAVENGQMSLLDGAIDAKQEEEATADFETPNGIFQAQVKYIDQGAGRNGKYQVKLRKPKADGQFVDFLQSTSFRPATAKEDLREFMELVKHVGAAGMAKGGRTGPQKFGFSYWDERGQLRMYVTNLKTDETVWQVHYEGDEDESTIFEDGYMKNIKDLKGLKEYMVQMGVMDEQDNLVKVAAKGARVPGKAGHGKIKISVTGDKIDIENYNGLLAAQLTIIRHLQRNEYYLNESVEDTRTYVKDEFSKRIAFAEDTSEADKSRVLRQLAADTMLKSIGQKGLFKKGGKFTFSDKVHAVEKSLKGKPVPKKYQKEYGKRYGKKTSAIAARKIIGAAVRDKKETRGKKMLLGGVMISTPPAIPQMGDHNNLAIHNVGN